MLLQWTKPYAHAFRGAAFAFVLSSAGAAQVQHPSPFTSLAGAWSGSGTVAMSNGSKERIRCRANYHVDGGGSKVQLQLLCASDSYRFELQGNIVYQDGEVHGTWTEKSRQVGGDVTGSVYGNQVDVMVIAQAFSATVSLTTRGDRQSVSIQSPGSAMSQAIITLNRGR